MLKRIFLVFLPLLMSKKFQMAALAMLSGLLAKYGLGFSVEQAMMWISPMIAAIVGQGFADHGKSAAEIAAAAAPPANDNTPALPAAQSAA